MRLKAATNSVVSFLDAGLSRAERRQQVVEIIISKLDNSIEMQSTEPGFSRTLQMPEGVSIVQVLPAIAGESRCDARLLPLPRRHRSALRRAIDQSPER